MKIFTHVFIALLMLLMNIDLNAQMRAFVKQVGDNADLYYMPDIDNPADTRRLTFNNAIDNHPTMRIMTTPPFDTVVVWSSNRSGTFELYRGTLPYLELTIVQLTFNGYSDRHPHFSHDGQWLVYTSKYRFEPSVVCPKSECSIPVSEPCGWYEGLHIMNMTTFTIFEIDLRNMPITGGGNWPATFDTWVGHPSFSHMDDRIIFSAALDANGSDWEVYSVAIAFPYTISNLTRHTQGTLYPAGPNPIQMSAGAHYASMDMEIIYSSTRTPLGNSQLFVIPASSVNTQVNPANQLDFHYANDYVPDQLSDGRFFFTSDQGPNPACAPPDTAATDDLDMFLINQDGSGRTNVTDNNLDDEMALIGDEVSWFCGIKPNLSECTVYPKIWNICWFREFFRMGTDPLYMPTFPKRVQYTQAWQNVSSYMMQYHPAYWGQMMQAMLQYVSDCNLSWMEVPSYWILPGIMEKWDSQLPANPALITPPNGITFAPPAMVPFSWTPIPGATQYGLQISLTPDFLTPIQNIPGLPNPQCVLTLPQGFFYWRASATNPHGTSWSTVNYMNITNAPPPVLTLQNIFVDAGSMECFDAQQTIFVGGGTSSFIVYPMASVEMIAGTNIVILPTTMVHHHGYFHAHIAPGGPFCNTPSIPMAVITNGQDGSRVSGVTPVFKVYPNPTTGSLRLEFNKEIKGQNATIILSGPFGDIVSHRSVNADQKVDLSLSGKPVGMYFVRVITGKSSETVKVVKQ
jgi:hypothetical protein